MAARKCQEWSITGGVLSGLAIGQIMYWPYPQGGTCAEVETAFLARSVRQRFDESVTEKPATQTDWFIACGGGGATQDDFLIYDPGDGTGGFISEDGTTNPNPPTNNPPPTGSDPEDMAYMENQGVKSSNQL